MSDTEGGGGVREPRAKRSWGSTQDLGINPPPKEEKHVDIREPHGGS